MWIYVVFFMENAGKAPVHDRTDQDILFLGVSSDKIELVLLGQKWFKNIRIRRILYVTGSTLYII